MATTSDIWARVYSESVIAMLTERRALGREARRAPRVAGVDPFAELLSDKDIACNAAFCADNAVKFLPLDAPVEQE